MCVALRLTKSRKARIDDLVPMDSSTSGLFKESEGNEGNGRMILLTSEFLFTLSRVRNLLKSTSKGLPWTPPSLCFELNRPFKLGPEVWTSAGRQLDTPVQLVHHNGMVTVEVCALSDPDPVPTSTSPSSAPRSFGVCKRDPRTLLMYVFHMYINRAQRTQPGPGGQTEVNPV